MIAGPWVVQKLKRALFRSPERGPMRQESLLHGAVGSDRVDLSMGEPAARHEEVHGSFKLAETSFVLEAT